MVLPSHYYRDPSELVDEMRERDRKSQGCGKCAHRIVMWGLFGCMRETRPEEDGYCRQFEEHKND